MVVSQPRKIVVQSTACQLAPLLYCQVIVVQLLIVAKVFCAFLHFLIYIFFLYHSDFLLQFVKSTWPLKECLWECVLHSLCQFYMQVM